ncbi:dCTP deaminase [Romboutsia hominis]|uniref:dCTP deaminase n=1 Tax=Romboutsia hominis TaxID=1507512 RepID=UPI000B83941C|nr:hypothetical protein [Romboutsia hominis]
MLVYDQILDRVLNYKKYEAVYKNEDARELIEDFNLDNLKSVSYDVTIGNFIRKFKGGSKTINLDNEYEVDDLYEEVDISNGYELKSGEFVLARLNERINMPDDLAGHIRPRTTFNKLGLIITFQHINPSYKGNLQIGIKNETPHTIILNPNLIIGQAVFETLDGIVREEKLYKNDGSAKYHNEDKFIGSKVYNDNVVKRAEELYSKIINGELK